MKEDRSPAENLHLKIPGNPEKSFSAAIEQMAQLLRSQVKLKERKTRVLSSSPLSPSFKNYLEQIAKLLRKEAQSSKTPKKRSWKQHSPRSKKN